MRINKYLAVCELGSRRKVESYVKDKLITINDKLLLDLSYDVSENDIVKFNGRVVTPQKKKVYIMLNKPKCYITSVKDEKDRKVVLDLLKGVNEKVFPVGRLDYNTQGLLLLTNDGDWANKIIHPSNQIFKTYEVQIKVNLTNKQLNQIRKGMVVNDIKYLPAKIDLVNVNEEFFVYNITIMEGKNREIRNIFENLNVKIYSLKRLSIGSLQLNDLKEGKFIFLNEKQKNMVFK